MSTEQIATQYSPEYLEEYNGYGLYVLTITFIIVETLCVSLRFYSRKLGNVPWGADDTLIIPGAILCLAICACCLAHLQTGALGHHEAAVIAKDPYQLVIWARYVLVFPLVYSGAVLFTKLAILAIYLRIFTSSFYRTATWVLVGLLIANWVALTVATCLMCIPLNYLWDRTIPGGHCINIDAFYCWSGLFNVVTDIAMLVLPLPVIWKLNTSRNIKVGLTILFATGSVGLITSIVRFANFFFHNPEIDVTWSAVPLLIWTSCEPGMYLVSACLPKYKPLVIHLWKRGAYSVQQIRSKSVSSGQSNTNKSLPKTPMEINGGRYFLDSDDSSSHLAKAPRINSLQREIEVRC